MKYDRLRDNLISIFESFDYTFKMYNTDGKATSNPYQARYFFLDDPNMMFIVNDDDNILEFHRSNFNYQTFRKILNMVRRVTRKYFIHLDVSTYNRNITPKTFSRDVIRKKMNITNKLVETKDYTERHNSVIVEFQKHHLKINNFKVDRNQTNSRMVDVILESYYKGLLSTQNVNDLLFLYENKNLNESKFNSLIEQLKEKL